MQSSGLGATTGEYLRGTALRPICGSCQTCRVMAQFRGDHWVGWPGGVFRLGCLRVEHSLRRLIVLLLVCTARVEHCWGMREPACFIDYHLRG